MPNWCLNNLIVTGKKKELEKFEKQFSKKHKVITQDYINGELVYDFKEEEGYSFQNFVPMPKEEVENWWQWSIRNWGTKWDLNPDQVGSSTEENGDKFYAFDTAWSPPVTAIRAMSKQFQTCTFTLNYQEEGVGIAGEVTIISGKIEEDIQVLASDGLKEFREYIMSKSKENFERCEECGCPLYDFEEECPICETEIV